MSTVDLPPPSVGPLSRLAPKPIKFVLNWGRRYSLWVFNFGLACCAIEFIATSMSRHDFIRLGVIPFAPGPRQADLMVVSGTVSDKMAPAVKRLYEQMPEPKYVISFGACSNCGGPYWDSYCVTKGVDQIIPVDVYVPGCPPRPEALLHGIIRLQEKIAAESLGERYNGSAEPVTPPPPPRPLSATVLRRPLQPPPLPHVPDNLFHDEEPAPDAETPGPDDETRPVRTVEPEAPGPNDKTLPVVPVESGAPGPDDETRPVATPQTEIPGPNDKTLPVATVEPETPGPNDKTLPVVPVEPETSGPADETRPVATPQTETPGPNDKTLPVTTVEPETPGPNDKTLPVVPVEPDAPGPDDETRPVATPQGETPGPDDETRPVPVAPDDETRPVPVADEPDEPGPDDQTRPVTAVEPEAAPSPNAETRRGRREHDPSIIPGLADHEGDDEIGRSER
ncbi:NADH-quinone oxidoreductase subunit NuoB [Actinomadura rudentiformis]|nr:NADH-quinone oxidoreductase subunit NuoB [Actinomadura rudentiformis]